MKVNWMTDALKKRIQARNDMKKKLDCYGGDNRKWREWKTFRNKVNKELKQAKEMFLVRRLQQQMENSKTLWDGVKSHLGWKAMEHQNVS